MATSSSPSPQQQKRHQRSFNRADLQDKFRGKKTHKFFQLLGELLNPQIPILGPRKETPWTKTTKTTKKGHFAHPLLLSCRFHSRILWDSLWEFTAAGDATRSVSLWSSGASGWPLVGAAVPGGVGAPGGDVWSAQVGQGSQIQPCTRLCSVSQKSRPFTLCLQEVWSDLHPLPKGVQRRAQSHRLGWVGRGIKDQGVPWAGTCLTAQGAANPVPPAPETRHSLLCHSLLGAALGNLGVFMAKSSSRCTPEMQRYHSCREK